MVFIRAGEQKIRFFVPFGANLRAEFNFVLSEDCAKVVLQSMTGTGLSPVEPRQAEGKNALQAQRMRQGVEFLFCKMFFKNMIKPVLFLHPEFERRVRVLS